MVPVTAAVAVVAAFAFHHRNKCSNILSAVIADGATGAAADASATAGLQRLFHQIKNLPAAAYTQLS